MSDTNMETLLNIGITLTKEKNIDNLFEIVLDAAMKITGCKLGIIYLQKDNDLVFKTLSANSGDPILPVLHQKISAIAARNKECINISDCYSNNEFDLSDIIKYDELIGCKTVSILAVPMEDDYGDVVGVLQLINAMDKNGKVVPFSKEYERVVLSLASQTAICCTNRHNVMEVIEHLDSLVKVMSTAIDARSPYNVNHTHNMAIYAKKFISWLNNKGIEIFDDERERQFLMSIWLHDIGKLVVPSDVMHKDSRLGKKFESVMNRMQEFRMQAEIDFLKHEIEDDEYKRRLQEIEHVCELIEVSNRSEFLTNEVLDELSELSKKSIHGPNGVVAYLTPDELTCISVRKGNLTDDERRVMESHVQMTRRMLSQVKFPRSYRFVPLWASAHHEFLNGNGYPDKLSAQSIPLEVRILTILDIYDALTADDRPYKSATPTEETFTILTEMADNGQIDRQVLEMFRESEAWRVSEEETDISSASK